ncbi:hypothetical protein BESB_069330 [Besnoitia besnoiti]|uniref:U3 small nucleolar RNA-associated protein 20 domain-containing protein n=1 Tax=Besnoitia besnoiti TaxID=94643 RepID=A0A2A9MHK4_BESBE|nr:hypothetical protein BESB_069330 [Besnoitia besnoiti]PFH34900.1 hypothetical protein BESB_069330 [Besnoitia besnoiti]
MGNPGDATRSRVRSGDYTLLSASQPMDGSSSGTEKHAAADLEARRRVNLHTKCFDPATERFTFLSFAKQLQIQLKEQSSPLHSSGFLDLLEEQRALLERSVGCAVLGKRRRADALFQDDAEADAERRKRRRTEELLFSSFREMVRHLNAVHQAPVVASLLSDLAPLCDSLPLLFVHRGRILQALLRHLLVDEAIVAVLNLLQALAKDLRSDFVPFLPSVFSSLLLLLRQLEHTVDAARLRLLFSCIASLFRYLARPLLCDFDFTLALFTPWLCGEDSALLFAEAQDGAQAKDEESGTAEKPSPRLRLQATPGASRSVAPAGGKKSRHGRKPQEGRGAAREKSAKQGKPTSTEIRMLAARAFACLLRKAGGGEEGETGDLLSCVDSLFRHMTRCSSSAREAYGDSVAAVLFESVKSVQCSFTRSFERLARFLFATVLFQKPYADRGDAAWLPSLLASAAAAPEAQQQPETGTRSESALNGSDAFDLYRAQVNCLVSFVLHARQHAKSLDSSGGKQVEALLLEFLSVAVKASPSSLLLSLSRLPDVLAAVEGEKADEATDHSVGERLVGSSVFSSAFLASLSSPFHAYFYNVPAPLSFTRHPFFSRPASSFSRFLSARAATSSASAARSAPAFSHPSASAVFLSFGLLTLLELATMWVAALPRLEGSFDVYLLRLLSALHASLVPSALRGRKEKSKARENSVWRSLASEDEECEINKAALILQPLFAASLRLRHQARAARGEAGGGEDGGCSEGDVAAPCGSSPVSSSYMRSRLVAGNTRELEVLSALSLLLPCALLRLLSLLWRAIPLSFCGALNSLRSAATCPDLFRVLICIPVQLVASPSSAAPASLAPADASSPPAPLCVESRVAAGGDLLQAYVNCSLAFVSMLHAHCVPSSKDDACVVQKFVHGFGAYSLRPSCDFLIRLLLLPLPAAPTDAWSSERAAAAVLLAQEVNEYLDVAPSLQPFSEVPGSLLQDSREPKKEAHNLGRLLFLQAKQHLPELVLAVVLRLRSSVSLCESSAPVLPSASIARNDSGEPAPMAGSVRSTQNDACVSLTVSCGGADAGVSGASSLSRAATADLLCTYSVVSSFAVLLSSSALHEYLAGDGEETEARGKAATRRVDVRRNLAILRTELCRLSSALLARLARQLLAAAAGGRRSAQQAGDLAASPRSPVADAQASGGEEISKEPRVREGELQAVLQLVQLCFRALGGLKPWMLESRGDAREAPAGGEQAKQQQGIGLEAISPSAAEARSQFPPASLIALVRTAEAQAERASEDASVRGSSPSSFDALSAASAASPSSAPPASSEMWLAILLSLFSSGIRIYQRVSPADAPEGSRPDGASAVSRAASLFSPLLGAAAFCLSASSSSESDADALTLSGAAERLRPLLFSHVPSILCCLSASRRQTRLDALLVLRLCSPVLFSPSAGLAAAHPLAAGTGAAGGSAGAVEGRGATDDGGGSSPSVRDFQDACAAHLKALFALEKIPVGLETERKLVNAYEALGRGAASIFSRGLGLFAEARVRADQTDSKDLPGEDGKTPSAAAEEEPNSTALEACVTQTVLPILEATVRTLLSQLFVKFSPLWQPAVDAVLQLFETVHALQLDAAARAETEKARDDATAGRSSSSAADRNSHACAMEAARLQAWLNAAFLSNTWAIITEQISRAVADLAAGCGPSPRAALRASSWVPAADGKGRAGACGRETEAEGCQSESETRDSEGLQDGQLAGNPGTVPREGEGRESSSFSACLMQAEWRRERDDEGDEGVTDPLSRHTRLLRLVEGIMAQFGKEAFVASRRRHADDAEDAEDDDDAQPQEAGGSQAGQEAATGAPCRGTSAAAVRQTSRGGSGAERSQGHAELVPRASVSLRRRRQALGRFNWLVRQTLCVMETLTDGGGDPDAATWSRSPAGDALEDAEDEAEEEEAAEDESVSVSTAAASAPEAAAGDLEVFRTHRVSLVPRACDCLRAVAALARVNAECFLSPVEKQRACALQKKSRDAQAWLPPEKRGEAPNENRGEDEERTALCEEGAAAERLWTRLLAGCAQRLVTIADASLQQLSIQVLQLSPALRPQIAPYAPLLVQLITEKSSSNALLRLRLTQEDDDPEEAAEVQAADQPQPKAKKREKESATCAELVIVQEQHHRLVVPLVVRILMTKVQRRAAGRSAGAVFAERRNIFAFLSSAASVELPLLLSILLYPLVEVRVRPLQGTAAGAAEEGATASPAAATAASGFLKEQYLRAFIAAQLSGLSAASLAGLSVEAQRAEILARCKSPSAATAVVLGECEVDLGPEEVAAAGKRRLQAARLCITVGLAECCRPANISSRLPGCLKTLQQLQDLLKRLLLPATPFLLLLYRTVLQSFIAGASAGTAASEETERDEDGERRAPQEPGAAVRLVTSHENRAYVKQTVHLCLLLVRQLLEVFPEFAKIWQEILVPAGPALQRLLDAAVATAAAAPGGGKGPRHQGKRQKRNLPAIVSLVCSWSAEPAYFSFFNSVVPEALPTLFSVPSLPAVLRRLTPASAAGRRPFRSSSRLRQNDNSSSGMLEAVLDAALLLSLGGMSREREEALSSSLQGEMKQLRRRRRQAGSRAGKQGSGGAKSRARGSALTSSSSSEEEDEEEDVMREEEAIDDIERQRQELRRQQKELEVEREQNEREGIAALLPHIGTLLASLEVLFQHRRLASLGVVPQSAAKRGPRAEGAALRDEHKDRAEDGEEREAERAEEDQGEAEQEGQENDEKAPQGDEEEDDEAEVAASSSQRSLFGVVRMKELQLLTRIARYAVDSAGLSLTQPGDRPLSATAGEQAPSKAAPSSASRGLGQERLSVVLRLMRLLAQSLPASSSLTPRALSPAGASRLLLSLEALLQLTFPLASQVRVLREDEELRIADKQAGAAVDSPVQTSDALSPSCPVSARLSELRGVMEAVSRHCGLLLQTTVSSACRAAVAKLFLAIEFAACGVRLFTSDQELEARLGSNVERLLTGHSFAGKQGDASAPDSDGRQEDDEVGVEAKGQRLLQALVPGGSLIREVLTGVEVGGETGEEALSRAPEGRGARVYTSLLAAGDEAGLVWYSPRATLEPSAFSLSEWRLAVALILFSLNSHRCRTALSRGLALPLLAADDDDQPDSSMQLIVLSALVATAAVRGVPSPSASTAEAERHRAIPPALLEPLLRHCLFLLGAPAVDWAVQQAAAAALKALVDSLVLLSRSQHSAAAAPSAAAALQLRTQLLAQVVMPFVRTQLKSPEEAQLRQGLQLLAYVVRTLAPVADALPSPSASASAASTHAAAESQTKRMRQLAQVFHLDLACLLLPSASDAVAAVDRAPSGDAEADLAIPAEVKRPQGEAANAGGDFFRDFLHMQRHRQGRALQRLAHAARERKIGATTLRLVALPLCFSSLLQRHSLRRRQEDARKKRDNFLRKEMFNQGLAEQAISCLEACSYRLKWQVTLGTVRLLSRFLSDFTEREGFLYKAICGVVRAFETQVKQAVEDALIGDAAGAEAHMEEVDGEREGGRPYVAAREEFAQDGDEEEEPLSGSEEGDEDAAARPGPQRQMGARRRLELMQARIKSDLAPLLYRLAFGTSTSKKSVQSVEQLASSHSPATKGKAAAQKEKELSIRPSIVAVLLLLLRLLPSAEFYENLPKLVRSVAFNLRSRDRDVRRKARGALVSMAVSLGPTFFSFLVSETSVLLKDRQSSAKKGGAEAEDNAGNSAQAFYWPVLLFTVHAMLKGLVAQEGKADAEAQSRVGGEDEAETSAQEGIDKAMPLLLPLIAEELSRISDPDRPFQDPAATRQHSKIDEARHPKGPSLVFLLSSCSSAACCSTQILPFLYSLLGSRRREGATVSSAYSPMYLEKVKDLFIHFVKGVNKNRSLPPLYFFLLSRRLLTLTVALLQSHLLHPLQLEQAGRRREHLELLLAKQELKRQTDGFLRKKTRGDLALPAATHSQAGGASAAPAKRGGSLSRGGTGAQALRPRQESASLLREDALFLRQLLLHSAMQPAGRQAGAGKENDQKEGDPEHAEGEEANEGADDSDLLLLAPDSVDDAIALAREKRQDGLRAAVAAKKDRAMLMQPGAARGISLEKALHKKRVGGLGGQGFDATSRATTVGFTGLRLLLSALKKWKFLLKKRAGDEPEARRQEQRAVRDELEKSGFAILICFCSNIMDLISWTMRCLPHLLPLHLASIDARGSVIANVTLRLFQSVGGGFTLRKEEAHHLLLACSRLLPLLLLHPKGDKWISAALNPHARVPLTHRQLLLLEMQRESAKLRNERLAQVDANEEEAPQRAEEESTDAGEGEEGQTPGRPGSAAKAREAEKDEEAALVLSESQLQVLKEEEDKTKSGKIQADDRQTEGFKEALLAQILHALESPQLRLSGLMLFKTLVLPHYRDVAMAALRGETEGGGGKAKKSEGGAEARKQRKTLGDCALLKEVYRGIDTIIRLMIQEAGEDAEGRRLAAICGDIYLHFLLNFPMTEKTQQYRVLFLLKNLSYSAPEGRRAVLNCVHKILIRFPNELVVARYSEVLLLSLSGRLVLEEDRTAHEMLRMLLLLLLDLAEDTEDPEHPAPHLMFKTAVAVLLQPAIPKLLALQELLLVFLDSQGPRVESMLPRVLRLMHRILLLAADRKRVEGCAGDSVLFPACRDWRVTYKALLTFEKLLLFVHPSLLDSLFSRAARAVAAKRGSAELFAVEGVEADGGEAPPVDARLEARGAEGVLRAWASSCLTGDDEQQGTVAGVSSRDSRSDAYASPSAALPLKDASAAAGVGSLWLEAVGEGLRHEHPWIRAVSLRCVGAYLAAKPGRSYRPSSPCLLYLRGDLRPRKLEEAGSEGRRETPLRTHTSPGAALALAALAPFCKDLFLEKNPAAVVSARALLLPVFQLALERPDLVFVPPRAPSRGGEELEEEEESGDDEQTQEKPAAPGAVDEGSSSEGDEEAEDEGEGVASAAEDGAGGEGPSSGDDEASDEGGEDPPRQGSEGGHAFSLPPVKKRRGNAEREAVETPEAGAVQQESAADPEEQEGQEPQDARAAEPQAGEEDLQHDAALDGSDTEETENKEREEEAAEQLRGDEAGEGLSDDGQEDESEDDEDGDDEAEEQEEPSSTDALALQVLLRADEASAESDFLAKESSQGPRKDDGSGDLLAFENIAAARASYAASLAFAGGPSLRSSSALRAHCDQKALACGIVARSSGAGAQSEETHANKRAGWTAAKKPECATLSELVCGRDLPAWMQKTLVAQRENSHPLVFMVRRLSFWSRKLLGTLGAQRRVLRKKAAQKGFDADTSRKPQVDVSTSVVRIGGILSVFQSLLHRLPLHPPQISSLASSLSPSVRSTKRKRGEEDAIKTAAEAADWAEGELSLDRLFIFSEVHLERLLVLIVDAVYRCSTVIKGREERGEEKTNSVLLQLLAAERCGEQDAFNGGDEGNASGVSSLWAALASLSPREQQREILTGGLFLLNHVQEVLKEHGREELGLKILAHVRTSVLSRRLKRKVDAQQQALLQPQKYAEKRRRQQGKKRMSKKRKVALLIAQKKGGKRQGEARNKGE